MSAFDAGRYWRTLRHLDARQLAWLVARRVIRWPWRMAVPAPAPLREHIRPITPLSPVRPVYLGNNRFRFLNRTREFGTRIDWSARGEARLWQYNLHYFDWFRQDDVDDDAALLYMKDWTTGNPPFIGLGWQPYPLSLRLVNWSYRMAGGETRSNLPEDIVKSFAMQAAWLAANLELHLRANHLLANAKGLLFAGVILDGPLARRLLDTGATLLERELGEQFLADGGHFERSPMYHAIATSDLLELADLAKRNSNCFPPGLSARIEAAAGRAVDFALAMAMPDGSLALFNDAAHGIAPTADSLAKYAHEVIGSGPRAALDREVRSFPESGYFVIRNGGDALIVDCGEIGPSYQPGHAHCDTLSFELALNGCLIVTDTGNFDYDASPERRYARSTQAHNTVEVDGLDQSEVWGAFRVGRRARPLEARLEERAGKTFFSGAHDGYIHLPGQVTHVREIEVGPGFAVRLRDRIEGGGTHSAVGRLHFANGLEVAAAGTGFEIRSDGGELVAVVDNVAAPGAGIEQTERFPEFGRRVTGSSLVMRSHGRLPLEMGCTIRKPT